MEPIYRYHAEQVDGWRFHYSTNSTLGDGWIMDGIAFKAPFKNEGHPQIVPIQQFYAVQSQKYGGWRYHYDQKMSPAENGWTHEKVAFYAFDKPAYDAVPIWQYHAVQEDGWRFLLSTSDGVTDGWTKDGIAFYAFKGDVQ